VTSEALYLTLAQIFPTLLIALAVELLTAARLSEKRVRAYASEYLRASKSKLADSLQEHGDEIASLITAFDNVQQSSTSLRRWKWHYRGVAITFLVGELSCIANVVLFEPCQRWPLGTVALVCLGIMCLLAVWLPLALLTWAEKLPTPPQRHGSVSD
jgi:uncharacterized membrane protein YhhN